MKTLELVAATANPDKLREIQAILASHARPHLASQHDQRHLKILLLPRPADIAVPAEDAETLEGNASIKAKCISVATGKPAVADDTGLEVDALGGAPGVYSARFAGPNASYQDNVTALLKALAGVPPQQRRARFRTVALVGFPDGNEIAAEGLLEGTIGLAPQGNNGFGYDCIFIPSQQGNMSGSSQTVQQAEIAQQTETVQRAEIAQQADRTLAEISSVEKNKISARGRAFRNLIAVLEASGLTGGTA